MATDASRSILITGCSSGIGEAAARRLRERGWRVFATARKEVDVARLAAEGFEALPLDLADSASVQAAVKEVLARTGGTLDALFNNGAYGQPGAVEDLTREVLREQIETNLLCTHELTCLVLPAMRRQGHGRIVQNSSILGFAALPYRGAYNCSKFALEGLTDTLRLELRGSGIHVSLIEPGPIATRFRDNAYAAYERRIDRHNSAHATVYRLLERRLRGEAGKTPFTLPADAVVDKLIHAIESPRPRARYYVTFPTYLFGFLKRILPTRWMDWVLLASTAKERQE
jgi:NAD(P)-dependent dehydrogenase (short-subunit alcohol dehydrogenase family)